MIERILKLSKGNTEMAEILTLEKEIIHSNNSRFMFLYAYYFPNQNLNNISEAILKTNDKRYINFFFIQIHRIDLNMFFSKILEYDNQTIFYALYDRKNLDDIFFIKGISKMLENGEDKYLYLIFYYYFLVLNRFHKDIFHLLLKLENTLNEKNYKQYLVNLRHSIREEPRYYDYYSPNKYNGHHGCIPDMIVCHISFDYGKVIKNFYTDTLEVSSHFAVSESGNYIQLVGLEDSAWANGTSLNDSSDVYYKFAKNNIVRNRKINANYYTYSIENESIDGSLTEKQYQTTLRLMCKIIDYVEHTYHTDFKIDEEHIVGHQDINPIVRTSCPGIKFPLKRLILDLNKIYKRI